MPLILRYDHPNGGVAEFTNVTKLEGVWFIQHDGSYTRKPTHYRVYVGQDPYTHNRVTDLVPLTSVRGIRVSGAKEDLSVEAAEYRAGAYTDDMDPEERRER